LALSPVNLIVNKEFVSHSKLSNACSAFKFYFDKVELIPTISKKQNFHYASIALLDPRVPAPNFELTSIIQAQTHSFLFTKQILIRT
jgi:hypothetical protein